MRYLKFALVFIFVFTLVFSPWIFQEGNPFPLALAAFKITILGDPIVKIDNKPETYMVKTYNRNGADAPFMELKKEQGYIFKNRGIGPYYEGNGHYYRFEFRAFTRKYLVIQVNEIDNASYPNEFDSSPVINNPQTNNSSNQAVPSSTVESSTSSQSDHNLSIDSEPSISSGSEMKSKSYYGTWIIKRHIPTNNISALSKEDIARYIGQKIIVDEPGSIQMIGIRFDIA